MKYSLLDRHTADHLLAWCKRQYRQPQEAAEQLEIFLTGMEEDDRTFLVAQGWPAVARLYEAHNPEGYAAFNS